MQFSNYRFLISIISIIGTVIIGNAFIYPSSESSISLEKKTERCVQMIEELAKVSGLKSIDIPDVEVVDVLPNANLAIAMFNTEPRPKISIHEWTYDICMEDLGKDSLNGLAFILAHELAHVSKKHVDRQLFFKETDLTENDEFTTTTESVISDRSALDSIALLYRGIAEKFNIRKNEAEADLFAGFTAYLAGYNTKKAGPRFLQRAYEDFELSTKKGKYVNLSERQEIAKKTGEKLDTLIRVFEMGNLLTMAGEYEMATNCYTYINKFYSSPALLNNIGLSIMLETTLDADNEILPYNLPYTIDVNFIDLPDKAPPMDGDGTTSPILGALHWVESALNKLNIAMDYFKSVQISHPGSYEAFLNQSIAEYLIYAYSTADIAHLRLETDDYLNYAITSAHKAKNSILFEKDSDKAMSDIYMMLAILEHANKNQEKVNEYYEWSKDKNPKSGFIKSNKFIIDPEAGQSGTISQSSFNTHCDKAEKVFGTTDISDFFNDHVESLDLDLAIGFLKSNSNQNLGQIQFSSKKFATGCLYNISIYQNGVENHYYSIFETNDDYPNKSACQMSIKDSISRLEITYGKNPRILESSSGSYRSYNQRPIDEKFSDDERWTATYGTIFYSNNSELVDKWYLFKKAKRF